MRKTIITIAMLTILASQARADVVYIAMLCAAPAAMKRAAQAGVRPPCSILPGGPFYTLDACERYTAKFPNNPLHCYERDVPGLRQAD